MGVNFHAALLSKADPVVCGRRLRPLSLAHSVTLAAIGSPFARGNSRAVIGPADFLVALKVCASEWPFDVSLKPTFGDRWRFWRYSFDKARFTADLSSFIAYIDDNHALPVIFSKPDTSAPESIPDELLTVATLMRRGGMSWREAWTMSVAKAVWLACALSRVEGGEVTIETEKNEALAPVIRAAEEKLKTDHALREQVEKIIHA